MSTLTQYAPRQAREPRGFTGGIASLADNRLYALQNPFALDGRVSSYPASARGFSVANSYLLMQPDAAMLIDTGFGKDEAVIRAQIESLIAPGLPLSMFPLRLNEFMSINNVESFARHFHVETCYTSNIDAALWFDFGTEAEGRDILKSMRVTAVTRADTIQLGEGGRAIDVMQAPIRLIATRWLYDRATQFVTPLRGDREIAAAAQVGFNVARTLHSVRVMGRDRPGIAAELTKKLADGRINLRGFSASVIGTQFLAYVAVDSVDDANKVIEILEKA